MNNQHTSNYDIQDWRSLLSTALSSTQEKQSLANKVGVSVSTLTRWSCGESTPHPQNIRALLQALPRQRDALHEAVAQAFPDLDPAISPKTEPIQEIPAAFYTQVMKIIANTPYAQGFWQACELILRQSLYDLDPYNQGLLISLSRCMPPRRGQGILSLRQIGRVSSQPLLANLSYGQLWGADTLVGRSIITGRRVAQVSQDNWSLLDMNLEKPVQSAIAYPIQRGNLIAGCMLVCSTKSHFSLSQQELGQSYAELFALIFDNADFHPHEAFMLGPMPPSNIQRTYLACFSERVRNLMLLAMRSGELITRLQAEEKVWQDIEKEFLELAFTINSSATLKR